MKTNIAQTATAPKLGNSIRGALASYHAQLDELAGAIQKLDSATDGLRMRMDVAYEKALPPTPGGSEIYISVVEGNRKLSELISRINEIVGQLEV